MAKSQKRVTLYTMNKEGQLDDGCIGYICCKYVACLGGVSMLIRDESYSSLILESKIQQNIIYKKQEEVFIIWSETLESGISSFMMCFDEKSDCNLIWEKICEIQGNYSLIMNREQEIVVHSENELEVDLPPCEIENLQEIKKTLSDCLVSFKMEQKLVAIIVKENYIKELLNLFYVCEKFEIFDCLNHLFEIFKNIFLLDNAELFKIMFTDDIILDIIGCLEYDTSSSQPKKHREYLKNLPRFNNAIPISSSKLVSKINQTYRVQYIQDVVFGNQRLPSLSLFISSNKVGIVTMIKKNKKLLSLIFAQLKQKSINNGKKRDLILFLKEFCTVSKDVLQSDVLENLYQKLLNLGVLKVLEITLQMDDEVIKSAAIGILSCIVSVNTSVVQEYILQQDDLLEKDQMLICIIIKEIISDLQLINAEKLIRILELLLEPKNTNFLHYFYNCSMNDLLAPLFINTINGELIKDDYRTVESLKLLLELLLFCPKHHKQHMKNYISTTDLLSKVLVLMKSKYTFLVLSALKFLRKIIATGDAFYYCYIIKNNLFVPVADAFVLNNNRNNLLDSAVIELFEFIQSEDIEILCVYVIKKYVQTFRTMVINYRHAV